MMNRLLPFLSFVISVFFACFELRAGDNDIWEPIGQAHWNMSLDAAMETENAVMLFEKVTFDDRSLNRKKAYVTIYRRIRILNREGRRWGDVKVPYLDKKQKIEKIYGRTVLPIGTEYKLEEENIISNTLYKSKGVKVKQVSFSLPGITDDCIIEYYIKYRLPFPQSTWPIQKKIPLLHGELRWKFYLINVPWALVTREIQQQMGDIVESNLTPNYLARPTGLQLGVQILPSPENPEEAVFTVQSIKAFEGEAYTLPDISLQARLVCYYSSQETPEDYWKKTSETRQKSIEKFCKKNKRLHKVISNFDNLTSREEKIESAYYWCQESIENITYLESDKESKKNKNVDDVIKNGYGTQGQINHVFYEMLRQLGFNPKMLFVVDRDENLLITDAKYWQFDRSLVAAPKGEDYTFYSPGDLCLKAGEIPWVSEGTQAFVAGANQKPFQMVPFSSPEQHKLHRQLAIELEEDGTLSGFLNEQRFGHQARAMRLSLTEQEPAKQQEIVRNELQDLYKNAAIDSISIENLYDVSTPLKISGKISFGQPLTQIAARMLLKPFDCFEETANPFLIKERQFPLMFDFAYEQVESLQVQMEDSLNAQIPENQQPFANDIGYCGASCSIIGKSLVVARRFVLKRPFLRSDSYSQVKELFQAREASKNLAVVLN